MDTVNRETLLVFGLSDKFKDAIDQLLPNDRYNIFKCATIDEAVAICNGYDIRLVIIDAESFSDIAEAISLCKRLVADRLDSKAPVLMVLPSGDEKLIEDSIQAGAIDVIIKPLIKGLILQRLRWIIQSTQTQDLHRALRQSETRLRTIITNASMVLFAFDPDGTITFIDGRGLEVAGRSQEDFLGRSILKVTTKEIVDDASYVLTSGEAHTSTVKLGDRYFETWYNPVLDDDGNIRNVIGVATDVTQREQAGETLKKSLNFYLTFFEDLPVPVWRAGVNGNLNYLNQSWLDFTGQSLEEAIHQGWTATVHADDRTMWREKFLQKVLKRQSFEIEYRMMRKDGEFRHVSNIGRPFYEINGDFGGFIGLIYDATDRKQAEQQLIELNLERERVKLLQEFISTVSHDLKTPLSSIVLYANLLRQTNTAEQRFQYSRVVEEQSNYLKQLLDNMLEMSRLDEEITTITFQLVNVKSLLEEIAEFYKLTAKSKNLELLKEIPAKLPNLLANEQELRRSISNLIDNAIKYTDDGLVMVKAFEDKGDVVIEVRDSGIGIDENDLPHIFERFYRADKSRETSGTGLGLAIVKKIIEAHGGQVSALSEVGKGTTLRIHLPMVGKLINKPASSTKS